ncbi:MAG: molybdopterin cofactor-binding domain-containing protein, partial [Acetobacterales bacterium]
KPEYCYLIERLVDAAARETGIDPAELRRRNMVRPQDLPWKTPTGLVYDSGDPAANMDRALEIADRAGFPARREEAARRGKLRGFGIAVYTEPDGYKDNRVDMQFDPTGALTVAMSAQTNGQGHETTFAQVVADLLGVPLSAIRIVQGDSDRGGAGEGTGGSRTATVSGAAMHYASVKIIEKGRRIAAQMMEAGEEDIEFDDGRFVIGGTDRSVDILSVARASYDGSKLPKGMDLGLGAFHHYDAPVYSYPVGCHICEVEIDRGTGWVDVVGYFACNDHGVVINPMLLDGQIHGGVAQGIGQALLEEAFYDAESGQLSTGSFMDYALPHARHLPLFRLDRLETRCDTNPLGVKGVGESGTTCSLPATINAVVDALAEFGVTHVDMPATPLRVWQAMHGK